MSKAHLSRVLGHGGVLCETNDYRYGFLWLKKATKYFLNRPIEWERHGTDDSFTGVRITPRMDQSFGVHFIKFL